MKKAVSCGIAAIAVLSTLGIQSSYAGAHTKSRAGAHRSAGVHTAVGPVVAWKYTLPTSASQQEGQIAINPDGSVDAYYGNSVNNGGVVVLNPKNGQKESVYGGGALLSKFLINAAGIYLTPLQNGNLMIGKAQGPRMEYVQVNAHGKVLTDVTVDGSDPVDLNKGVFYAIQGQQLVQLGLNGKRQWGAALTPVPSGAQISSRTIDLIQNSVMVNTIYSVQGNSSTMIDSFHLDGTKIFSMSNLPGNFVQGTLMKKANGTSYFVAEDNLFGAQGTLYALDKAGNTTWTYKPLPELSNIVSFASNGDILIGSTPTDSNQHLGNYMAALTAIRSNGTLDWKRNFPDVSGFFDNTTDSILNHTIVPAPNGNMYVLLMCSYDDIASPKYGPQIYALTPSGKVLWSRAFHPPVIHLGQGQLALPPLAHPVVGKDGTLYIPWANNGLEALGKNGRQKWFYPTGAAIQGMVMGNNGDLYLSAGNHVYALKIK